MAYYTTLPKKRKPFSMVSVTDAHLSTHSDHKCELSTHSFVFHWDPYVDPGTKDAAFLKTIQLIEEKMLDLKQRLSENIPELV